MAREAIYNEDKKHTGEKCFALSSSGYCYTPL